MRTETCEHCCGKGSVLAATGEELRAARKAAGLSMGQLSARLQCSTTYISDLERNQRHIGPKLVARWEAACLKEGDQ